jgi:hypothetical protein
VARSRVERDSRLERLSIPEVILAPSRPKKEYAYV